MTAEELRRWRVRIGLTQGQAARALGLGRAYYNQLEGGYFPIRQLIVLATRYIEDQAGRGDDDGQ